MSQNLELPYVLEQETTHPCCNNLQLWNAKLCKGDILPSPLWQRQKKEQGTAVGKGSISLKAMSVHPQRLPITAEDLTPFPGFQQGGNQSWWINNL